MAKTPVIYCSDVFHPPADDDDIFDIVSVFAMTHLDIKGIVIDRSAGYNPGYVMIRQLDYLSGKNTPWSQGLPSPLSSINDTGESQAAQYQDGVNMILNILTNATERTDIISVGGVSTIAAAMNRNKQLFIDKAGKIVIFIGEASDPTFQEWNVRYDPFAFVALMRSGLDIYWCPCFDGGQDANNGHATFWLVNGGAAGGNGILLNGVSNKLNQYFIYNDFLTYKDPAVVAPVPFLLAQPDATDLATMRNIAQAMWCTIIFSVCGDKGDSSIFTFSDVNVEVDSTTGNTLGYDTQNSYRVKRFNRVGTQSAYATNITNATNTLYKNFPYAFPTPGVKF